MECRNNSKEAKRLFKILTQANEATIWCSFCFLDSARYHSRLDQVLVSAVAPSNAYTHRCLTSDSADEKLAPNLCQVVAASRIRALHGTSRRSKAYRLRCQGKSCIGTCLHILMSACMKSTESLVIMKHLQSMYYCWRLDQFQ